MQNKHIMKSELAKINLLHADLAAIDIVEHKHTEYTMDIVIMTMS